MENEIGQVPSGASQHTEPAARSPRASAGKTSVWVVGYGGPEKAAELHPFLESVLEGARVPKQRVEEVVKHYEAVGSVSPYNQAARAIAKALEGWLAEQGRPMPVGTGFRHSHPSLAESITAMRAAGCGRAVAVVLSPLRSQPSYGKYAERVEEARQSADPDFEVDYIEPFSDDPLYIDAICARVREVMADLSDEEPTYFLFTAHSIPSSQSQQSGYADQLKKTCEAAAAALNIQSWGIAYQSRSGRKTDPWLGPDVKDAVKKIPKSQFSNIVIIPVGFLCDNVEILYDLDLELCDALEHAGLGYFRAPVVGDHPAFIELLGRKVLEKTDRGA